MTLKEVTRPCAVGFSGNYPRALDGLARLIIHRYAMLGLLNEEGFPLRDMGMLDAPQDPSNSHTMVGKTCPECGNPTVIHKDGCDFCTACGYVGQCDCGFE